MVSIFYCVLIAPFFFWLGWQACETDRYWAGRLDEKESQMKEDENE